MASPAPAIMGATALAMFGLYAIARRRSLVFAPIVLRILAVIGFVTPGAFVLDSYRRLERAREWTRQFEIDAQPIVERFLLNSVVSLTFGFILLVTGIFLARRLDRPSVRDAE